MLVRKTLQILIDSFLSGNLIYNYTGSKLGPQITQDHFFMRMTISAWLGEASSFVVLFNPTFHGMKNCAVYTGWGHYDPTLILNKNKVTEAY